MNGGTRERYALQKRGVNGASCQSPSCNLIHKLRRDVQFIHALDHHTKIMAEHLAECFVNLCGGGLASQSLAKLRLNHAESRFDVGSFVIVIQKLSPLEIVVEEHP